VVVNLYAHAQQFAAQVAAIAAQHVHWHGPRCPLAPRRLDAQQAAIVAFVGVGGHGVNVQGAADPLLGQRGRRVAFVVLQAKVPHARAVLHAAFIMPVIENDEFRALCLARNQAHDGDGFPV